MSNVAPAIQAEPPPDYISAGALVTRETFLRWTGLKVWDFEALRSRGEIGQWRPPGATRAKYYKVDAARIAGWRI